MEFGRCREHFDLSLLPNPPHHWDYFLDSIYHLVSESTSFTKVSQTNRAEDLVNGVVAWKGTVETHELSFQTLWNIVATTTWVDHGSKELKIETRVILTKFKEYCHKKPDLVRQPERRQCL